MRPSGFVLPPTPLLPPYRRSVSVSRLCTWHSVTSPVLLPSYSTASGPSSPCLRFQMNAHAPNQTPQKQPQPPDTNRSLREFTRIALAATAIGVVLLCFDILISLVVLTLAAFYALAVLFDVRPVKSSVSRGLSATLKALSVLPSALKIAWKALRREVRKGLKD